MKFGAICMVVCWIWFLVAIANEVKDDHIGALSAIAIAAFLRWVAVDAIGGAE